MADASSIRFRILIGLLLAVALGITFFKSRPPTPVPAITQAPPPAVMPVPPPPPKAEPLPPLPESTPFTQEQEMEQVSEFIAAYRRGHEGGNPVGSNEEITRSLLASGDPLQPLPLPDGMRKNSLNELCDRWGTPYFFHQQSGTEMQIRSAGPDRKFWTADDREWK